MLSDLNRTHLNCLISTELHSRGSRPYLCTHQPPPTPSVSPRITGSRSSEKEHNSRPHTSLVRGAPINALYPTTFSNPWKLQRRSCRRSMRQYKYKRFPAYVSRRLVARAGKQSYSRYSDSAAVRRDSPPGRQIHVVAASKAPQPAYLYLRTPTLREVARGNNEEVDANLFNNGLGVSATRRWGRGSSQVASIARILVRSWVLS